MSETFIAQTLYALTKGWTSNVTAREELAVLLQQGLVKGFPAPVQPDRDGLQSTAWTECVAAAKAAPARLATAQAANQPLTSYALLTAEKDARCKGVTWQAAPGSVLPPPIGPLWNDPSPRGYLYLFPSIDTDYALRADGDAEPGLYPRLPASFGEARLAVQERITPRARLGAVFFVLSVCLALASLAWTYGANHLVTTTLNRIATSQSVDDKGCVDAVKQASSMDALETARNKCDLVWSNEWARRTTDTDNKAVASLLALISSTANFRGGFSMILPVLLSAGSIVALIAASGLAARGVFHFAFIDGRNRFSLSRFQMISWAIVLLGGYVVLSLFNTAFLSGMIRELDFAQAADIGEARQMLEKFPGIFPSMTAELWGVLGLTVAISPFLSQAIQNRKLPEGATEDGKNYFSLGVVTPAPAGTLETRSSWRDARWSDLVMGEEEANKNQLDISRLQYLIITFILLSSYIILLLTYVLSVDGTSLLMAFLHKSPPFPSMPPVDVTFLGLLAISHVGYLAFKALPSTSAGGAAS